jgi:hypothetical protein
MFGVSKFRIFLNKEKYIVECRPLLGNDREIWDNTTAVAK